MKRLLSKYSLRFPRSLVYMLQSTEYYLGDYFEWYYKVKDFRKVEKTGRLKFTKKTLALLFFAWAIYLGAIAKIAWITLLYQQAYGYYILWLILLVPLLLPYLIVIPLLLLKYFIQLPLEIITATRLKKKISAIKATKIAIAGSYGKTTTREILATVIGAGKKVAAPSGSLNTLWGIYRFVSNLKGDEEVLIFEIGEYYPGDVARLAKMINPDIGVITGINEAHLKRFGSIEKTVATIYELVDVLGDKPVYINKENKLAAENARGNYQLYSSEGVGKWKVIKSSTNLGGIDILAKKGAQEYKFYSQLLGLHLVGTLALSVSIADTLGLTAKELTDGVAATKPFARRLEKITTGSDIVILDDSYNGNPDGVRAVIDFLKGIKGYKINYVTSGLVEMGEKNREVHLLIAKELTEGKFARIILVKNSATEIIAEGLKKENYGGKVLWYETMAEAREAIPHLVAKGDLVLFQTDWPDQYQ